MQKRNLKPGELVHVPSDVTLMKCVEFELDNKPVNGTIPTGILETQKPSVHLFVSDVDTMRCKILYKGSYWLVNKKDIYPIENNRS